MNAPDKDAKFNPPDAEQAQPPTHQADEADAHYLTGLNLWLVVGAVTIVTFLMLLDMTIIVTAIPHITTEFHSLADVGWYGSAYLLANCALQPLTGKLYSHLVLKYTFVAFLCLFEIGSVICGASKSSTMLIVGRAVAGMGGSGLVNGALTVLSAIAPKHQQPVMIGVMMGIGQIAIVCGPLLGGALTQHATWRWCYYINLPIGAIAAAAILFIPMPARISAPGPETSPTKPANGIRDLLQKLDLVGFIIFAGFAIMISLALEWGGSIYDWRSGVIIGLFCGGGMALIVFVFWERHVGDDVAMIPGSVAGKHQVWSAASYMSFFASSLFTFSFYLPIYFQAVKGISPTLSGVYMMPGIGGQILAAVLSGVIIGKTGYYTPWAIGSAAIVAVGAGLVSTFQPHTSTAKWVVFQLLAGIGRGCGMQTPVLAIQNSLPPNQIAIGMALVIFGQTFGGAVFLNFASLIFGTYLKKGLAKYAPEVDPRTVIAAGATGFREKIAKGSIYAVSQAYNFAFDKVFYLAVGTAVATFVFSFGMGWKKIKTKKDLESKRDAEAKN